MVNFDNLVKVLKEKSIEFKQIIAREEFADSIANKQYIVNDGGHINAESGYTSFEQILEEI